MAIVYPLSLPAVPLFASMTLDMVDLVGVSTSGFTAQQEVQQFQGQFWAFHASFPSMLRAQAEPIAAVLAALKGQFGKILLGDPLASAPRGIATGTPLVSGANAIRSSTLVTKGWSAGVTGILKAGDYMQIGSGVTQRMYKVLADTNSDGSGNATFDIWPNLREALSDGTAITLTNCKATFRLSSNKRSVAARVGNFYSISFDAIEAM